MGNKCVAGGGAPTRADITVRMSDIHDLYDITYNSDTDVLQVVNNTKYELTLNPDEKCGRECNCFGWQVFFL